VLAGTRQAEVGAVLAAVLRREGIAVVAGVVGQLAGLAQQCLPVLGGQSAAVPWGARVLTAVVEEPDVVALVLERLDGRLDELVELDEVVGQVLGALEVHAGSPRLLVRLGGARASSGPIPT